MHVDKLVVIEDSVQGDSEKRIVVLYIFYRLSTGYTERKSPTDLQDESDDRNLPSPNASLSAHSARTSFSG